MRSLMTAMLLVLGSTGCGTGDEGETAAPDRSEVEEAKADGLDICWMIGLEAGCDVCEELDWYGDGVCDAFCDEIDPDCTCGGLLGQICAEGYYCDYPEDSMCGAADMTGVCVRRPGDCTYAAMEPVCGCDGETHPSACQANLRGVDVASLGACGEPEPRACGGFAGLLCDDDEYCDYDDGCGFADGMGTCVRRPGDCTYAAMEPVCGCDGETHPSACQANLRGVDVAAEGICEEPPVQDCRESGCAEGEECQYCWGSFACVPEGAMC